MMPSSRNLQPLHDLFAPGRPAACPMGRDGQRTVAWHEFAARVRRLGAAVQQRREARWLLTSDDALEFAAGLCAVLYAGKQAVIPPNTRPGTLQSLAGNFDARLDALSLGEPLPGFHPGAIHAGAAVIDLYTSGSTGEYKRVRKTLAQFEAEVTILESLWGDQVGAAAILATAPHQHIYGLLFRIFWPLASGRTLDAVTCAHPAALLERLALCDHAVLISSPAQLARLPELLPLGSLAPRLTAVFSSGGALSGEAAKAWVAGLGAAPIEVFGSTETGGVAWRQQAGADSDLWTPFPCHQVGCSESGALTLRSPFLADDRAWEMDDAVALMPDGRFRLLGRLDRVLKIEEKRLSLPDLESRLSEHSWVDAAAALALSGRRQSIGAAVVLNARGRMALQAQGRRVVTQALRRHLAAHFDAVLLPRRWRFPDRLPVDERGKLTHAALSALFEAARDISGEGSDTAPLLPEVLSVAWPEEGRSHVLLELHVRPDIVHFAGHFPAVALLPGVVQVDWAIRFARRHLPLAGMFSALDNLKFLAVIRPGARLQLSLSWDGARRHLDFFYAMAGRKCSSGRVLFNGAE